MKKCLSFLAIVFLSSSLMAAPIGEKRAREIAKNFFASTITRGDATPSLELAWAGYDMEQNTKNSNTTRTSQDDDALIYIYNRTDANGFVVIAGDDSAERSILAFSHENSFSTENMAEGAKAMLDAWCKDIANLRNNPSTRSTRATPSTGKVVVQYETALWNQGEPYNNECPIQSTGRSVTGCVATATAIIFYYHKWPEKGVGTIPAYSYTGHNKETMSIPANVLGRTYDYANMLSSYKNVGYSNKQASAVAALMYDIGTSVSMQYNSTTSSAGTANVDDAAIKYFGYSKQTIYLRHPGLSCSEWTAMLQENLSDCGPMCFRGSDSNGGGHAFVLDGYTDTGYFHINYGWAGLNNGFYLLPKITYFNDQGAVFNMIPDKDGSSIYRYSLHLKTTGVYNGLTSEATLYKKGAKFKLYMALINRSVVAFDGIYGIAHCDKNHKIKRILYTSDRTSRPLGANIMIGHQPTVTISDEVNEGDCLLAFYKGPQDTEWIRIRGDADDTSAAITMITAPDELAKNIEVEYDKAVKSLVFSSPYATQCSITNNAGSVVASRETMAATPATIDLSTVVKGEYTCSFMASGEPYSIKLKL